MRGTFAIRQRPLRQRHASWLPLVAFLAYNGHPARPRTPAAAPLPGSSTAWCDFDTAAATGMHRHTIALSPAGDDLRAAPSSGDALAIAEAVAAHFLPPARVSLPFWARVVSAADSTPVGYTASLGHGLDDFIVLPVRRDGHLAGRNVAITTASPELNAQLLAAILAADSAGAFPKPSVAVQRRGGKVVLRLVDAEEATAPALQLMTVEIPVVRATRPVKYLGGVQPEYPVNGRRASVDDSVELQYVIDEEGKVNMASARVLRGRYADFIKQTIEALPKGRFEPARVGECAVPLLAQQLFVYQMRR